MHRNLGLGGGPLGAKSPTGVLDGKIAGLYDLEETLGRGHFAVVKLARHVFTGEKVAVKVIDKSKLDDVSKAHLFQEVRCMKLVQHPNVVRLYEVIDTATKLYLILELGDGGDLYDYIMRHDLGLSEQLACDYFRQIVRAISYCHRLHVVHRDLKPENVVFFEKAGVVKLTDFGFSNKFCPGQKLETSCGSLAYSAPEILLGDSYDAPAVDVWSLGVILFMLVCGQAPFQEANDSETLTMIMDCKYTVPTHISEQCKNLIARMLVRDPEKRATLVQIAEHPWLKLHKDDKFVEALPLVSREQLSEEDHNLIVQKMANGNIATKEEIQESLDKDAYDHISATYYLLAERKLKSKRIDQGSQRRPDNLAVAQGSNSQLRDTSNNSPSPCLLTVPRTPGDIPQRSRKCSIVQEDEEEEDLSGCSGREELAPPHNSLNRRGSRSEGRLNLALQERLDSSEIRRTEQIPRSTVAGEHRHKAPGPVASQVNKWQMGKSASIPETADVYTTAECVTTNIITESSTITIPIATSNQYPTPNIPKYKTMPPSRPPVPTINFPSSPLNEIFEENDHCGLATPKTRQFVSSGGHNQRRTTYEQRRSKFHKARTASCSSSDASDDDSESRKKRAHKLNTEKPPLRGRRDSHDDSSDSQEPGSGTGGSCGRTGGTVTVMSSSQNSSTNTAASQESSTKGGGTSTSSGRKNAGSAAITLSRRHKSSRRRNGETRLRESQSLNRITEVQEDSAAAHSVVISTTLVASQGTVIVPKVKGLGAKILHGLTRRADEKQPKEEKSQHHLSRKDTSPKSAEPPVLKTDSPPPDAPKLIEKAPSRRSRLFGKYFNMHRKLCSIPIPNFLSSSARSARLYKTQSCGSLVRDRISAVVLRGNDVVGSRQRATSATRNSIGGGESDINQNMGVKGGTTFAELSGVCATHLGPASKCCSFC